MIVNEFVAWACREQMSIFHCMEEHSCHLTLDDLSVFTEQDFINSLLEVLHCMRISLSCVLLVIFYMNFQQWRNLWLWHLVVWYWTLFYLCTLSYSVFIASTSSFIFYSQSLVTGLFNSLSLLITCLTKMRNFSIQSFRLLK